jgi:ABC-2 type transport system permease protein
MTRLLRIAVREYLAYVKTIGFWLSMLTAPAIMAISASVPFVMTRSTPPPVVAVVLQPQGPAGVPAALRQAVLDSLRTDAGAILVAPPAGLAEAATPQAQRAVLAPYLTGARQGLAPLAGAQPGPNQPATTSLGMAQLDYAVIVGPPPAAHQPPTVRVWSREVGRNGVEPAVTRAVGEWSRSEALRALGIAPERAQAIMNTQVQAESYSTRAAEGRISFRDRLPGIAGFVMGIALWSAAMTGAGILLNSVIEEKSSRILEVLLSSASVPQIMGGKILGVAAVTATTLGVWAAIGGGILIATYPQTAREVAEVMMSHGLIFYFLFYFVAGYLMYATLFITVGAFCETSREAQTLLGPMMLILIVPMMFLVQSLSHPDSPILRGLSWVPLFTPFIMGARAASEPPVWEVIGTGVILVATIAGEVWVATRAFRAGALSTSRFDIRYFLASLAGRGAV